MKSHHLLFVVLKAFALLLLAQPAQAFEIQEVTSPSGIKAWLVEAHNVPILAMDFSFQGGASEDRPGKEGAAALMAALLTEGAGNLQSEAFKLEAQKLATSFGFSAGADTLAGSFYALSKNRDASLALLTQALMEPRFDNEPFERLKQQTLQSLQADSLNQASIGSDAWYAKAFPGHLYGRPNAGSSASVEKLQVQDMKALHRQLMNRRGLHVAVVGDIDASALRLMLDKVFGKLPDEPLHSAAVDTEVAPGPILQNIDYEGPQTMIFFGNPSLNEETPAGWACYLLAEIMGGRATFARLNQELREKSGLTYSVSFGDNAMAHAAYQMGSFTTANATGKKALAILQEQLKLMATQGPTEEELRKVKAYVNGSYPLGFTNSASISKELLFAQQNDLSTHFADERPAKVNAVTIDIIKKVAARLLKPESQIIVVVGRPE